MTVRAYAKINLTLEVFARRADGFHALKSVVQPITLADTLEFERAAEFATDTGYPNDLIVKAAQTLAGVCPAHLTPQPYRVKVEKHIPVGGGLGGGSADAAATLLALNGLWGLGLSPERLAEIGAAVGSDVPALVLGAHYRAPVMMCGRGEDVRILERRDSVAHYVLVSPRIHSSTPAVYAEFDRLGLAAAEGRANFLEGPALSLYPEIGVAMAALREAGAENVMMSGSGSTVFGTASSDEIADVIAMRMQASGKYDIIRANSLS